MLISLVRTGSSCFLWISKSYGSQTKLDRTALQTGVVKIRVAIPGDALGPNMYGCVPLRCCDFYPVWEHFSQFKYPVWEQNYHCSPVWGQRFGNCIPFWEHFCRKRYPAWEQEWWKWYPAQRHIPGTENIEVPPGHVLLTYRSVNANLLVGNVPPKQWDTAIVTVRTPSLIFGFLYATTTSI